MLDPLCIKLHILIRPYNSLTCYRQIFKILASLCSLVEKFGCYVVRKFDKKFSYVKAQL